MNIAPAKRCVNDCLVSDVERNEYDLSEALVSDERKKNNCIYVARLVSTFEPNKMPPLVHLVYSPPPLLIVEVSETYVRVKGASVNGHARVSCCR